MSIVLSVVVTVIVCCIFLASARVAVVGLGHPPSNRAISVFVDDRWAIALFLLLPWYIGDIARGDVSPLPWSAFAHAASRHGILDGVFVALSVLTVELWLLWDPAHSYIQKRPTLDKRTRVLARSLNFALGLLLLIPHNPIFKLFNAPPA